ncbi:uncharacterized protein A1O9_07835 [Exophiala aquamarina CBS 119918]|uniref:GPI inositol-deacylase winged helix domain-containing protein n=1 Tax=Exophiala aquamarina CBS 119918 TaxID=1182545 RepID=A0A072P833_9EURO|nr:uncharacterized protein A1O9_07835 [Exophiala aquamarina CBS 119918]KEF56254.1 hypothetical protein A1O9_07835 [Exophiala aquamarina CBS 119918]
MVEVGLLPDNYYADEIVDKVSQRANGMFLWVRLFIDFLQLPASTLRERIDAIENLNRLDGLDSLYCAILDRIAVKFPGKSRKNVQRMFQWVAFALRPLHTNDLQIAVAIPFGRVQTPQDIIPNFGKSLGVLLGSLIEVTSHGRAQFIHSSAQEFFISIYDDSASGFQCQAEPYRTCANRSIASACLTYLCYTAPARPLGNSSQVTPDAAVTNHRFPLLMYSVLFWSDYLVHALRETETKQNKTCADGSWEQLVSLAAKFLYNPQKVTLWIEAAFLFGSPRIQLPPQDCIISSALPNISDHVLKLLSTLFTDLGHFCQDLAGLERSWAFLLESEPNEIWEPSISTFTKSRFWEDNPHARLVRLVPLDPDLTRHITIQSQVSNSGSEIGIVKLIPPE